MVSLTVENIADFISAYIIGNLLQMAFRFWAFRRWVFPDQFARNPEKALESALTAGGIAEVFEDEIEGGNVTLLRAWRNRRASRFAQLGDWPDSSDPGVENLVIQQRVHLAQLRNVVELQRIL